MNAEHHELRAAFERFLAAKRGLRHAYRTSLESRKPAGLRPVSEGRASEQAGNHPATTEELRALKDENERMRKSLALLHAHSLGLQDRLDALLAEKDEAWGACEALSPRM